MAKEYIEREAVVAFLENMAASRYLIQCFENKEKFPTADVAPVVHGEWIPKTQEMEAPGGFYYWGSMKKVFICSICGRVEKEQEPYCHCGARMDGGKNQ